jgi:hypothetical protein
MTFFQSQIIAEKDESKDGKCNDSAAYLTNSRGNFQVAIFFCIETAASKVLVQISPDLTFSP